MLGRISVVALVGVLSLAVGVTAQPPDHLAPAHLDALDDAQLHGTVTPPGTDLANFTREIAAYDDLVQGYPGLTEDELRTRYFKTRRFGDTGFAREYSPRSDVTIRRSAHWGEPIIYGETDEAAAFGAGFVSAEDRLVVMEALRALGRAEAFELLGTSAAWLADAEITRLYGYTEEELQAQIDRLPAVYGQPGTDVVAMLDAYVAGINEFITAAAAGLTPLPVGLSELGIEGPAPWRPTDVVAVVSVVRALFGASGGTELTNAAVLAGLVDDLGTEQGTAAYEDFRTRVNADGPVHTSGSFPYNQPDPARLDPDANVLAPVSATPGVQVLLEDLFGAFGGDAALARAQLEVLAEDARIKWEHLDLTGDGVPLDLSRPGGLSNFVIAGGSWTTSGHPILLGGPQAAYFSPQILLDYELHSPTIHARGAGFPGLSMIVVMGRTQDYAWTPTAGGSDMIDTFVVELCEPGGGPPSQRSVHYLFDGECVEMERRLVRSVTDSVPPGTPGRDLLADIYAERTVHGPVVARGAVGDTQVAVARKRSTYMKEVDAAISILRMNRNEATTGEDFVDIFVESHNLSTNWGYANASEIAYVHGGLYPVRDPAVHPDFPVWGDGRFEWATDAAGEDRWLPKERWPHDVRPAQDYLVSWNNRVAPDWGSADSQWGFGSVYRSDMLEQRLLATGRGSIDPVKLVQIMEEAGLTDLRGFRIAPLALEVLAQTDPPSPREARMVELLAEWVEHGALRRDGDGDGSYDREAAVAIMDAWWEPLVRAMFDPVLGDAARLPMELDNPPSLMGSAYQGGYYSYVHTDLSLALGHELASPTSRTYCGGDHDSPGDLRRCSERLWSSLAAAGGSLGGDDPDAWTVDAEAERIRFLPAAALSMHWVNRPTTQQIAMFGARGAPPAAGPPPPGPPPPGPAQLPATGGGILAAVLLLGGAVLLRRRLSGRRTCAKAQPAGHPRSCR